MLNLARWMVSALAALHFGAFAVVALRPSSDEEVLEVLPAITRSRPAAEAPAGRIQHPDAAAAQARQDIAVARQTGDTRYWGRAQAVLVPWWDQPEAPVDLAILQATVQQGRHEFAAARVLLHAVLVRAPGHAQGWLNLAALERLSARYQPSLQACDAVARAGQALYAQACRWETLSLQGHQDNAARGLQGLIAGAADPGQRSWLWSLLAENEERAGRDVAAADAYRRSLAQGADLYTSIAYSDLLLRTGKTQQALLVLAPLPETDAVLLRRASALRRQGDARWSAMRVQLQERVAELLRRGDDPTLHGRELALAALWLDDDPARALALARSNLLLQREPLDWWLAKHSAAQAGDAAAAAEVAAAIAAVGLHDVRLESARRVPARRAAGKAP